MKNNHPPRGKAGVMINDTIYWVHCPKCKGTNIIDNSLWEAPPEYTCYDCGHNFDFDLDYYKRTARNFKREGYLPNVTGERLNGTD